MLPAVKLLVPAHQVIAGHHKVGFRPLLCQLCPVSCVAVHSHAGKLRRELLAFLLPVEHQRCRADDEAGQALAAFLHGQQVAEHLHGLAKAHIVGQNAAHAVAVQRAQPAVAIPLVLAQHIVQAFRRSILAVLHGVKAAADAAERIVAVETQKAPAYRSAHPALPDCRPAAADGRPAGGGSAFSGAGSAAGLSALPPGTRRYPLPDPAHCRAPKRPP